MTNGKQEKCKRNNVLRIRDFSVLEFFLIKDHYLRKLLRGFPGFR